MLVTVAGTKTGVATFTGTFILPVVVTDAGMTGVIRTAGTTVFVDVREGCGGPIPGWKLPSTVMGEPILGWKLPNVTKGTPMLGAKLPRLVIGTPILGWKVPNVVTGVPMDGVKLPKKLLGAPILGWSVPMLVGNGWEIGITWVAGITGVMNCTDGNGIKVESMNGWLVAALENGKKLLMLPWFGNPAGALIAGVAITNIAKRATPRTIQCSLLLLRVCMLYWATSSVLLLSVFRDDFGSVFRRCGDRSLRTWLFLRPSRLLKKWPSYILSAPKRAASRSLFSYCSRQ
jgi:hypothetical protein